MRVYNQHVAPGSECNAWQDYHEAVHRDRGHTPDDNDHLEDEVPSEIASYWLAVANEESDHYDHETGERRPERW